MAGEAIAPPCAAQPLKRKSSFTGMFERRAEIEGTAGWCGRKHSIRRAIHNAAMFRPVVRIPASQQRRAAWTRAIFVPERARHPVVGPAIAGPARNTRCGLAGDEKHRAGRVWGRHA